MGKLLDKLFPSRICRHSGHNFVGWESMGPHMNNPEMGSDGGVFYGLRYVVRCARCNSQQD